MAVRGQGDFLVRRWGMAALVAALAHTSACLSPTLPLPPPDAPTVIPGVDVDHVELRAGCNAAADNSIIVIINTNPAVANDLAVTGSRTSGCGAWDASVYAHSKDALQISQQVGDQFSSSVTVVVP